MNRFLCLAFLVCAALGSGAPALAASSKIYASTDGARGRTYLFYRPANIDRDALVPLVVVLHGGFGSAEQAESFYNWDAAADKNGFAVVYPDGVGRSWNAGGGCCGQAARENVDDVGFLSRVIQSLVGTEHIDPSRVYLTGLSNGAALAYRYGCEGSFPVAAIGGVAGSLSAACVAARPVSVMEIHGLDDRNIPFVGGEGSKGVTQISWLPVVQTLDIFRTAANCSPPFSHREGAVLTSISTCAQGYEVRLISVEGAGHQWPGGKSKGFLIEKLLSLDTPSRALDATSVLWAFFAGNRAALPAEGAAADGSR